MTLFISAFERKSGVAVQSPGAVWVQQLSYHNIHSAWIDTSRVIQCSA